MARFDSSIVMALSDLRAGGAERVVVQLLNHWPRDHSRPVLLLAEQRGPYLNDLEPDVEVLSCDLPFTAANTPRVLLRMRALLKGIAPAAVFAHSVGTSRMLARARFFGIFQAPLVTVLHTRPGWNTTGRKGGWVADMMFRQELKWVYSGASRVVSVSRGIALEARAEFGISYAEMETIYNPVDLLEIEAAQERSPNDDFFEAFERLRKPIVISVGRLSPPKNFMLLLDAYSKLPQSVRGSLLVLGEGPLRDVLESKAIEVGIQNEVFMPGFVSNPWWYMKRADLYVLSSNREGYPLVLVEASACGLPIVATDCEHGPSEIIQSDAFGTLVPVGDAPALANAMVKHLARAKPQPNAEVRAFLSRHLPRLVAQSYIDTLAKV